MLCGLLLLVGCHRHRGGGGHVVVGAGAAPRTEDERTLYAVGLFEGRRLGVFGLSPQELSIVMRGMSDQVTGAQPLVSLDTYGPRIQTMVEARQAAQSRVARERGRQFIEQAAREQGAQRLPSGMVFRELQAGTGPQPSPSDEVSVNYRGTLPDGTVFDNSYDRHQPATFQLSRVIPCWTEGVQRMHVGGRARLVCPPELAYGDRAQSRIPAGSTLVFEIELVSVRPQAPPAMPPLGVMPSMPNMSAPTSAP
jgi:FKBP-type peptidyl-prolyl cis-trans isomerase FkpA